MQAFIFFFQTLFTNILSHRFFASFVSNGVCKVSLAPEFSAPQYFFYVRHFLEYLSRCYALYRLNYSERTPCWNRLHKKMNMVFVRSYFNEDHLISLPDLKAYIFYFVINFFAKYHPSIFCRTNKVVQQYRNIVPFMYIFAHT